MCFSDKKMVLRVFYFINTRTPIGKIAKSILFLKFVESDIKKKPFSIIFNCSWQPRGPMEIKLQAFLAMYKWKAQAFLRWVTRPKCSKADSTSRQLSPTAKTASSRKISASQVPNLSAFRASTEPEIAMEEQVPRQRAHPMEPVVSTPAAARPQSCCAQHKAAAAAAKARETNNKGGLARRLRPGRGVRYNLRLISLHVIQNAPWPARDTDVRPPGGGSGWKRLRRSAP